MTSLGTRLREVHRATTFRRALARFRRRPADPSSSGKLLDRLWYGWGNTGWSARGIFLEQMLAEVSHTGGPVLECGSGLSTILLAVAAERLGTRVWSLEHTAEWADVVRARLEREGLATATVHCAPLRNYGAFAWYDPPLDRIPRNVRLVLCDGPPGDVPGGRYGLVPVLRDRFAPGCVILLDDIVRDEERAIAHRWADELGTAAKFLGEPPTVIARLVVP